MITRPQISHFVCWPIVFLIFRIFTKFQVIGKENLKDSKIAPIIVGNHETYFDPYIIGASIPWFSNLHPVHYLTQDEKFLKIKFRIVFWLFGAFPGKVKEGVKKALERPISLLGQNKTVGIFLEGCYHNELEKSRVLSVISSLSIKTKKPVIPVFIFGIYDKSISWRKILAKQREVKVIFGKPVYPSHIKDESEFTGLVLRSFLQAKLTLIKLFHEEEKKFWSHYAEFYHYLERAQPYKNLLEDFGKNLPKSIEGKWLDLGSGSGAVVELLRREMGHAGNNTEIIATDFEPKMITFLQKRFKDSQNINIQQLDLAMSFNFPDNYFDSVTANLVLPYLIHHEGEVGLKGFIKLLKDVYRILKPKGKFFWSSPKNGVNFFRVFFASWKDILDLKNLNHLYFGPAILKQALQIQHKGKCGIYHFLDIKDLERILSDIGFVNIKFSRSMAGQVDVISCQK